MVCNIYESNGDGDLVVAMLESYLEARGMQANISRYDKAFASDAFAAAHIELTPALIIDDELVIAGEQLEAREILVRLFETIENDSYAAGGCSSGGCSSGGCSSGGGCGCS